MANRKKEVEAAVKDLDFDANDYRIELNTSLGKITLELDPAKAPGHCKNIIGLTRIGYYDGVVFHRVIKGFMIQGGCPQGTGTGGPGYTIDAEFNDTRHVAGVLSAARTGDPNSAGSQFFICLGAHTHLDGQYTAFGKTANDGCYDVVEQIGNTPVGQGDRPRTAVTIESAKVIETARG